jgi:hypothetical protein
VKKIINSVLLMFAFSLSIFSCKKGDDNHQDNVTPRKNTVTYTSPFSGKTYTVNEANSKATNNATTYVDGKITSSAGTSSFSLDVVGNDLPFTLSIHIPYGPIGRNYPGSYEYYSTQTQCGGAIKIKDKYSDLYAMPIVGDSIFVTNRDSGKIIGNYVLHAQYGNSEERVLGTFTINDPVK